MRTKTGFHRVNTILIISQDVETTAVWEGLFRMRNCHPIHETTGQHALQTARLLEPQVVLFNPDLHHPEGIDLLHKLRAATKGAILLLAPGDCDAKVFEYYKAGVDEHIPTPVNPLALLFRSMAWLVRQERAQSDAKTARIRIRAWLPAGM